MVMEEPAMVSILRRGSKVRHPVIVRALAAAWGGV